MPPVAVHVTAVLLVPLTVALNCRVAPVANDTDVGATVTDTELPVTNVTIKVAVVDPAVFVAVSV